jgi:large subunit ribosomal protein L30
MTLTEQDNKQLTIKLVRSLIGRLPSHRACAHGLGLRRLNQVVIVKKNPCNLGMVKKISYLLKIF